ncbi:hypothetical protein VT03_00860 [Planctomyces sp. SH-PL14]|nr:hypothetical protein VT03_00860 [Planctomyces sp. SH-PL14]
MIEVAVKDPGRPGFGLQNLIDVFSGVTIGEMVAEPRAEWNSEGPKTGPKPRLTTDRSSPE